MVNMIMLHILIGSLKLKINFSCHDIAPSSQVKAVIGEFTDFALIWWREYKSKHTTAVPTTWEQLKTAMRHRFVPSYYARDLLNKIQCFQQGSQSVEDYYQELQKGMVHRGIMEKPDGAMAHFRGGLNCEIQDILDYKEYADMTQLFEFACNAEPEVQGRRSSAYSNSFVARRSSFDSAPALPTPSTPTTALRERMAKPAGAVPATGTTPPTSTTPPTTGLA
jgi:hypothetical protein